MAQDVKNNVSHRESRSVSDRISTGNPRVPVQCVENPEGQNGCVIFENTSYSLPLMAAYVEDHGDQNSGHHEILRTPVQCVENPEGQNGCVVFDSGSHGLPHGHQISEHHEIYQNDASLRVSDECQEDQHVQCGLIEFENFFYTVDMQPRVETSEDEQIHEDFF